ncbi:MAG: hypothetical protein J3Q66DRAFT_407284 [Benniella sp.]|nr:MAG: hypothetical protein J3Q66DRAFT_407284 [Benniella sp.]
MSLKLTHNRMSESLIYISELECTVLDVKVIEGLGTAIDVVLSNDVLREGDRIVVYGLHGATANSSNNQVVLYYCYVVVDAKFPCWIERRGVQESQTRIPGGMDQQPNRYDIATM